MSVRYLLESNMDFVFAQYKRLLSSGIDMFKIDRVIMTEYGVMAPPIAEMVPNERGVLLQTVVDGSHRVALAMNMGRKINTVLVTGSNPDIPFLMFSSSREGDTYLFMSPRF